MADSAIDAPDEIAEVVLVTGYAGAGRTTAIHALEDLGWEAVDNLPLRLLPRLVEPGARAARLAIGVDSRTRGFSAEALTDAVLALRTTPGVAPTLIFLEADDDALVARFTETRRRHPLAPSEDLATGLKRERDMLAALRARADIVIDTTKLSPHQLKARIAECVGHDERSQLALSVQSFSFRRGAPREADMVFDCRFLRNPHWDAALRPKDGRDAEVAAYVGEDPLCDPFFERVLDLVRLLLPAYRKEGKAYLCLALGCTGGRHRSVALSERLTAALRADGERVTLRHRELDAKGAA